MTTNLSKFINILDNLKQEFPYYCFTAIKWNLKKDIIDDLSDFDLRFVLDTFSEDDIQKFCIRIGEIFLELKNENDSYNRIFEHPPGYIYTKVELISKLGLSPDISTWSFIHGKNKDFKKIIKIHSSQPKTTISDNYFKDLLINRARHYNRKKEILYPSKSYLVQKKYNLAWHYYSIILYAMAGITFKLFPKSKTQYFAKLKRQFPKLKNCSKKILLNKIYNNKIVVSQFESELRNEISQIENKIDEALLFSADLKQVDQLNYFFIGLAMYRARISRYSIYHKYFKTINKTLLIREKNDFRSMSNFFNQFISTFKPTYKKSSDFKEKIKIINDFLLLDFSKKKTYEKLSEFLIVNSIFFNELGFILLNTKTKNTTINCLKIKITSKCTRKCSYCIFSNNQEKNMTFDEFKSILAKFSMIHINKIFINGGEPTLNPSLELIGKHLQTKYPSKEKILGTNCTLISKSEKIFDSVVQYFDTFAIGCDDEHENFEDVKKVVPSLINHGKKTIINTLTNYISPKNKNDLDNFCNKHGIIHVYNELHHFCKGKKNKLSGICKRLGETNLLITQNGDCFKCFNAVDTNNPDSNINNKNFLKEIFKRNKRYYKFCYYCDEYISPKE